MNSIGLTSTEAQVREVEVFRRVDRVNQQGGQRMTTPRMLEPLAQLAFGPQTDTTLF